MVGGEDLGLEGNRLLEADNRLLLPVPLRTIVSNVISIRKTVYDPVLFRICDRICEKGSYTRIRFSNFVEA